MQSPWLSEWHVRFNKVEKVNRRVLITISLLINSSYSMFIGISIAYKTKQKKKE